MLINEKYHQLIKQKVKIDKEINKILSHAIVCSKCDYCIPYEEIDLGRLFEKHSVRYGFLNCVNHYYECNECNTNQEMWLSEEEFMKILKLHELTYEQWIEKYPKNYINKSI
jgi:hypothetical protein